MLRVRLHQQSEVSGVARGLQDRQGAAMSTGAPKNFSGILTWTYLPKQSRNNLTGFPFICAFRRVIYYSFSKSIIIIRIIIIPFRKALLLLELLLFINGRKIPTFHIPTFHFSFGYFSESRTFVAAEETENPTTIWRPIMSPQE